MEFKHPMSMIIAGPSGSGKTVFVRNLVETSKLFDTKFFEVIWCYSVWQDFYSSINARFIEGLPEICEFDGTPKLLILDDLMHEADDRVGKLFTKYSHHKNVSVIYITQNMFHQKKGSRDLSLNAHYLVIFKNPRDKAQIQYLARQLCPENPKFLQEAYTDATEKAHGYLVIDMKQQTEDHLRYLTNIFDRPTFYVSTKNYKYK